MERSREGEVPERPPGWNLGHRVVVDSELAGDFGPERVGELTLDGPEHGRRVYWSGFPRDVRAASVRGAPRVADPRSEPGSDGTGQT